MSASELTRCLSVAGLQQRRLALENSVREDTRFTPCSSLSSSCSPRQTLRRPPSRSAAFTLTSWAVRDPLLHGGAGAPKPTLLSGERGCPPRSYSRWDRRPSRPTARADGCCSTCTSNQRSLHWCPPTANAPPSSHRDRPTRGAAPVRRHHRSRLGAAAHALVVRWPGSWHRVRVASRRGDGKAPRRRGRALL